MVGSPGRCTLLRPWYVWPAWPVLVALALFFEMGAVEEARAGRPGWLAFGVVGAVVFSSGCYALAAWRLRVTDTSIVRGVWPFGRRLDRHSVQGVVEHGPGTWSVVPRGGRAPSIPGFRVWGRGRQARVRAALAAWRAPAHGEPAPSPLRIRSGHPLLWAVAPLNGLMGLMVAGGTVAMAAQGEWDLVWWMAPLGLLMLAASWALLTQRVRMDAAGVRWCHMGIRYRAEWSDVVAVVPHARATAVGIYVRGAPFPKPLDYTIYTRPQRARIAQGLKEWARAMQVPQQPPAVRSLAPRPKMGIVLLAAVLFFPALGLHAVIQGDWGNVYRAAVWLVFFAPFVLGRWMASLAWIDGPFLHTRTFLGKAHTTPLRLIRAVRWGDEAYIPPIQWMWVADLATTGLRPRAIHVELEGGGDVSIQTSLQPAGHPTLFARELAQAARAYGARLRWDESIATDPDGGLPGSAPKKARTKRPARQKAGARPGR